jgi:hypothetical protein
VLYWIAILRPHTDQPDNLPQLIESPVPAA